MEKRVVLDQWEKVTRDDFNNFGLFPEAAIDTVVGKVLIPDKAYEGLNVIQSGTAELTVGNGYLFSGGKVFFNDSAGGTPLDILSLLPPATNRIIAVTVWGVEMDSEIEPRTFLTDADTRATVARDVATEHWRWANIGTIAGPIGPDPARPTIPSDVLVVAWVLTSSTGVVSITPETLNRVPTLRDISNRMDLNDQWRQAIGVRLDTLASDIAAMMGRIRGLASFNFVEQIANDLSRVKDQLKLPDTYTDYGGDRFITDDESDTVNVAYLANVEDGLRYSYAAVAEAQLALLNPFDPGVIVTSNQLLPKYLWTNRIILAGTDTGYVAMAQYPFQSVDVVIKQSARWLVRYGTEYTNSKFWPTYTDPITGEINYFYVTFARDPDEVFEEISGSQLDLTHSEYALDRTSTRLPGVWEDYPPDAYWPWTVARITSSGFMAAQSFLNAQDGWMVHIDLFFQSVAATGSVELLLCECTADGKPDYNNVIGRSTKAAADLRVSPATLNPATTFDFTPVFLQKGKRFAFIVVTAGNHTLWTSGSGNLYGIGGTYFYSTDGAFFQANATFDLSFRVGFALFQSNRVEVQLQPLQLTGGIASIKINADTIIPGGKQGGSAAVRFEVQKDGVWHGVDNSDGGPTTLFTGLPALLPLRAVFQGTRDVHCALGVGDKSKVLTRRARADFAHISALRTMAAPVAHVDVHLRIEKWLSTPHHTLNCRLLTTGPDYTTVLNSASMVETIAPDDPDAIIRIYTFNLSPSAATFKIRVDGTTDNVLTLFHVSERLDIGYN